MLCELSDFYDTDGIAWFHVRPKAASVYLYNFMDWVGIQFGHLIIEAEIQFE